MRRALLFLAALAIAALTVFLATYLLGRHPSLEAELERLTAPRVAPDPGRSKGIPSLQPAEAPTEDPVAPSDPIGEPLGAGILVNRSPLEPAGMAIVADLPALAAASGGQPAPLLQGLTAFLSRTPAGMRVGLRALAGAKGECGASDAIVAFGQGGGEAAAALASASGRGLGSRNLAGAVEAAATDLAKVTGEHCVVIVSGGEDGCRSDFCGPAPPPGGQGLRIHVLLLAPRLQPGADPAMPDAGSAVSSQLVFEPTWAAPYRCLADRSGGSVVVVSTPAELEAELRRIAGTLAAAVVVRGFRYTGQEIKGVSPGGDNGWGAALHPGAAAQATAGAPVLESELLPSVFAVSPGVYVLKAKYAGQQRTAAVAVAAGERAEVRVTFSTGALFLQALDAAGGEIVGDSTGFRCAWGVDVFAGGGEDSRPVASTCSFPARLELAPGTYRVRARWKGVERVIEEMTIEAGASEVHTVSFGKDSE